jgi:hypothetical protein
MNNQPPADILATARDLIAVADRVMSCDDDEAPAPDWFDDRDVAAMFVIQAAIGLAEQMASRPDLGLGLMSGRYALQVNNLGTVLLEQPVDPLAEGV